MAQTGDREPQLIRRALIVGALSTVVSLATLGPGLRLNGSPAGTVILGVSGLAGIAALVFLSSASFRGLRYLFRKS